MLFLSGAQPDILDSVRADRAKFIGLGFAIFFTGVLACVSMCFALNTALGVRIGWAIAVGVGWAFLIMGIDRMLVVSMVAKHGKRNFFLVIVPRLLLGLLLSIVISTPIVLQIFRPEIDQEIGVIHQAQISAGAQSAQGDQLGREITGLQTQIKSLTQQIAQTSSQIASLNQQYQNAQDAVKQANAQYQCQIYGGSGCVAGNGPLAKTEAGDKQAEEQKAAALQSEISGLRNDPATTDRQRQLNNAESQLKADQQEQATATAKANQATFNDNGLLIRLQALGVVAAHKTTVQVARLLLFLLFVVIECMPVLGKVLLNFAGTDTYDQALEHDKTVQLQVAAKMSDDKLAEADSILDEQDRNRAALAARSAAGPRWTWRPGWPFLRTPRGAVLRGPGRLRPGRRPPRARRRRRWLSWPWRRAADPWSAWVADGADPSAGPQLPPVFLREPRPGTPNGQQGGPP
jgi:Domain of unknown function (DUF4407)